MVHRVIKGVSGKREVITGQNENGNKWGINEEMMKGRWELRKITELISDWQR